MAENEQQGVELSLLLMESQVTIHITWSKVEIHHLCMVFSKESENPTFMFISPDSSRREFDISDVFPPDGTCRDIFVYGLQKTDHCQMFNVCSSSVVTLTEGEPEQTVTLPEGHDVQRMSITSVCEIHEDPEVLQSEDNAGKITFKLEGSACELRQDVLIVIQHPESNPQDEKFLFGAFNTSSIEIGKAFLPSEKSKAKMYIFERTYFDTHIMIYKVTGTSTEKSFEPKPGSRSEEQLKSPEMTRSELDTLMEKASNFAEGKQMYTLTHLFRNKDLSYFQNIWENDGIMKKYRKDYNGDPASCINGTIDGLFISAFINPFTEGPPDISPFGPIRINIPAKNILNENTNMYFADFYCFPISEDRRKYHYVTVVVTERDSMTDQFCNNKLLPLDPSNNPFIKVCDNGVEVKEDPIVEVFYTENIKIPSREEENDEIYYEDIEVIGEGGSKMYGIPKDDSCRICSINR